MKLISCYIENFGGLHHFSLFFDDGITEIERPNGFGKTTLAEYIRAMFYGFPRAGQSLEKNIRKKYYPWQGGKCGGNLVFSHSGKTYRVERTFGHTPKQDTFRLYDLETNRESQDFSENIGGELFHLDADSFVRSTYLPQIHVSGPLTTDSIRAKLSNLVEDTNDINRYEKAIEALKKKRASYLSYKGQSGQVADAQASVSRLQTELAEADSVYQTLDTLVAEKTQLQMQRQEAEEKRENLRNALSRHSEQVAQKAISQQYRELLNRKQTTKQALNTLLAAYPVGIPKEKEIEKAEQLRSRIVELEAKMESLRQTSSLQAGTEKQKYPNGVPTEEQLRQKQAAYHQMTTIKSAAGAAQLSKSDREEQKRLQDFFCAGVPEEAFLSDCKEKVRYLQRLDAQLKTNTAESDEEQRLRKSMAFFAAGIPSEEELHRMERICGQITVAQQAAEKAQPVSGKKEKNPGAMVALLLSLILLAAGVGFLVLEKVVSGVCLLGLAVVGLIGAGYLSLRQMLRRELSGTRKMTAEPSEDTWQKKKELDDFLSRYPTDAENPAQKLGEISAQKMVYETLLERHHSQEEKLNAMQKRRTEMADHIEKLLAPYFHQIQDFEEALMSLSEKRRRYLDLQARIRQSQGQMETAAGEAARLETEIARFLQPYCGEVAPSEFSECLTQLQQECAVCRENQLQQAERDRKLEDWNRETAECRRLLSEFKQRYALADEQEKPEVLRRDEREQERLKKQYALEEQNAADFYEAHNQLLSVPMQENTESAESLKQEEAHTTELISQTAREILQKEQKIGLLRQQADEIPEKQDALEKWLAVKREALENSRILDRTIAYLEKAREAMSCAYMGGIQKHFADYLQRLTGEDRGGVFVTPDLKVQIERQGQARELTYFSAGQTDLVEFCMRMALVDVLFPEEKPMIILDDPFVNLDDAHTAKALQLVEDISRDYQILYLFCNSSRRI